MGKEYWTYSTLKGRGWSDGLIARLLVPAAPAPAHEEIAA